MAKAASTKPAKGTRDFLADDLLRRRHVVQTIQSVYASYGFEPLETPSFERLESLLGKYGDEGDQLVFKILNRGQQLVDGVRNSAEALLRPGVVQQGRSGETAASVEILLADLGLRYDLTVPLARVVAQHGGRLPAVYRRYQIQPVWRADNPGKGRFREFYQCDVDIVGTHSLLAEVEVTAAVSECLKRLGFEAFHIRVNDRKLLSGMMRAAGIDPALETSAIVGLDKLDKVGEQGVRDEWSQLGIPNPAQDRLFDWVGRKQGPEGLRDVFHSDEDSLHALDGLQEFLRLAERGPAAGRLRFDPTLARGLGYYTGPIFEIAVEDLAGSLGGGGRYDGLVGMFSGKNVPACGFSLGLERILVVMEQRNMFPELRAGAQVLVAFSADAGQDQAVQLVQELRSRGVRAELGLDGTKPGAARKQADDRGFDHAVIADGAQDFELWSRAAPQERGLRLGQDALFDRIG